jgi:hypothetical protein
MLNMTEDDVLLLQKTIYGLKQSARRWHEDLVGEMQNCGFVQSKNDKSAYSPDRMVQMVLKQ